MRNTLPMLALCAAAVLPLMTACGSSAATDFYVLEASADRGPMTTDLRIGVGPIELPAYLDRDGIVTRSDLTSLEVAEFDRWAEPLDDAFGRVLSEDLSRLFGTEAVFVHPWGATRALQMRIPVRVVRFDSKANGDAVLVALWSILDEQQNELVAPRRSIIGVNAKGADFAATTAALSHAVSRLSRDIAAAVPDGYKGWKAAYDPAR